TVPGTPAVEPGGSTGEVAADDGAPGAGVPGAEGGAGEETAVTQPAGGNGGATDVGITEGEILLGNISTLTGPVPGLFRGALVGAQAWAAYQNAQGGIHGRKVRIVPADDRFDGNANRAAASDLEKKTFALLGSFSVVEDGGAGVIKQTGVPDIGYALSTARRTLPNQYSPLPAPEGWVLGPLNWYKERKGAAVVTNIAGFYGDVPASESNYRNMKAAAESVGWRYLFDQPLQPTESNYTAYVIRMRQQNARGLVMTFDVSGMARMAKAVQQQGLKLDLPLYGPNAYDRKFLELAGSAAEGTTFWMTNLLFGGEDDHPEVRLFNTYLKKVAPGFSPDVFALYSWASGRLFAQAAAAGPPQMTRKALLEQLSKIDQFDSNGLLAPTGPASKRPSTCFVIVEIRGGRFVRVDPASGYRCDKGGYFRL
ncbi:MAG TPA: ABC transporter substrate-binding protein, partial [Acidimicrobiales bacterium]|nr:ABC transporter substrate-binding protein [Acidimicrobiales bacterium]